MATYQLISASEVQVANTSYSHFLEMMRQTQQQLPIINNLPPQFQSKDKVLLSSKHFHLKVLFYKFAPCFLGLVSVLQQIILCLTNGIFLLLCKRIPLDATETSTAKSLLLQHQSIRACHLLPGPRI